MTGKLYVRKGGDIGAGDIEMTGFTGRKGLAFMDGEQSLIQLGMRCANGEASQGTFKIIDPIAELPRTDFTYNIPAHTLVTWIEDEPGVGIWLSRGRTAQYEGGRGEIVVVDNDVEYDVTVDDGNVELRGQAFTEAWVRPAETDFARIAAVRAYTLNGSGSTATHHRDTASVTVSNTHLCPNTNTVTMPAKTYPVGTQPQDVIADCADTASKIYSVVIHHTGGSHLCLLYILETDHTTYASAAKITDELSELAPTHATTPIYAPHWEAGKASLYDGQALLSGLVSIYGTDQSVFVDNANATPYDYWVDTFYDSQSVTAAQASTKASGLLLYRSLTNVTHRVSIIMLASQTALVAAGMSIQIKAAAAIAGQYLDTWQTRRIAECQFEPMADGRYWAHLRLDRTPHNPRGGKAQPAATTPKPAPPPEGDVSVRHYRMGDAGGDDFDWPDFAQNQCGGAGTGAEGSLCAAFVAGSAFVSQDSMATVEGATYRVSGWTKQYSTRHLLFCFYDIGPYESLNIGDTTLFDNRIGTPTTLHDAVLPSVWTFFTADVVAPAGALSMGLAVEGSGGLSADEIRISLLGSGSSDPFALTNPGTSPYFARSDDPRLTADDQHLTTRTQQLVTNNSGVTLAVGDVVVPDTSIDGPAVTRVTTANSTAGPIGIVVVGGADDAAITVMWSGAGTFVNTIGTPADGDYLYTSTTAGAAQTSATRSVGAIGRVVRDDGAGETLSILWWGVPDSAEVSGAPTFVAAGASDSGAGATVPGLPAGWAANDIHLLAVCHIDGTASAIAGWSQIADSPQIPGGGANAPVLTVYWRRAVGGDTAPTVPAVGNVAHSVILGFRGCPETGNPWDVTSGGTEDTGDTSLEATGDTTTQPDTLVVTLAGRNVDSSAAHYSAWTNASLLDLTEIYDAGTAAGLGSGLGVAAGVKTHAGTYGTTTATVAASTRDSWITIALLGGLKYAVSGSITAADVTETTDGTVQAALDSIRGRAWKQPVRVATAAAGTLASSFENGDTVDGVVLATGNRILLKDQAAGAENGIYTVNASGAPTRGTDMDASSEVLGAAVLVTEGTANADKVFICTTNATITLGSTALVFAQIGGGGGTLTVQEDDATVDAAATTLDFTTALNVTSSPAGEANIAVDLGTASTQAAAGNHTHTSADSSKASASADYTPTTTTATDVTGATLSLATGTYIVVGNFDVTRNGATNDRLFEGVLDVGGVDENDLAILSMPISATVRAHAPQVWRVVLGSTTTVKLQARHSGGTAGDFTVNAANTTLTAYVAGGSGTTWVQDVSESGTSFANFTAGTGTWASDGTIISQTDTAAAYQEARFTAKVATGLPAVMEAEMRFPTTGAGGGANRLGGLTVGFDGSDVAAAFGVRIDEAADQLIVERIGAANLRTMTPTIAKDIWYKLRVVRGSDFCDVYLDGTLQGTTYLGDSAYDRVADYVGVYSFGTRVDYRNIKVWTLRGGLPA